MGPPNEGWQQTQGDKQVEEKSDQPPWPVQTELDATPVSMNH